MMLDIVSFLLLCVVILGLISVVKGAPTNNDRYEFSQDVIKLCFRFLSNPTILPTLGVPNKQIRAWYVNKACFGGVAHDLAVLTYRSKSSFKNNMDLNKLVEAPILKGQILGKVTDELNGQLIASQTVSRFRKIIPKAGLFSRLADSISLGFHKIF